MSEKNKKNGCLKTAFKIVFLLIFLSVGLSVIIDSKEGENEEAATNQHTEPIVTTSPPEAEPAFTFSAEEVPTMTELMAPISFPVGTDEKKVGEVVVPAGTQVSIVSADPQHIVVSHNDMRTSITWEASSLRAQIVSAREEAARVEKEKKEAEEKALKERRDALLAEIGEEPSISLAKNYIKARSHDPKSISWGKTWKPMVTEVDGDKYWSIKIQWRAKNAFGATVLETGFAYIRHEQVENFKTE